MITFIFQLDKSTCSTGYIRTTGDACFKATQHAGCSEEACTIKRFTCECRESMTLHPEVLTTTTMSTTTETSTTLTTKEATLDSTGMA